MHSMAPRRCFFIISRARSVRYFFSRSQLTRCCQSSPAMPKFAVPMLPPDATQWRSCLGRENRLTPVVGHYALAYARRRGRAPTARSVLAGVGLEARRLDAGDGARLVLVGSVAGNADRADHISAGVADQHAAAI